MARRALLGFLLFFACALAVSVAAGEDERPGQPVDGIYYFNDYLSDIGIETKWLVITFNGYQQTDGQMRLVKTRELEPREFDVAKATQGVIAFSIHLDKKIDVTVYDQVDFTIENGLQDGPEYLLTANSYQLIPKTLYLYALQTSGLERHAIDHFASYISEQYKENQGMIMQAARVQHGDGMDDSDIFYFVGGDMVSLQLDHREQYGEGEMVHGYSLSDCVLLQLKLGQSVTVPLQVSTKGEQYDVSATITKVAILREEPSAQSLIDWPPDAIGRVVVTGSGVNVREGGGTSYKVVGKVNKGDVYFVKGKDRSGWYALALPNGRVAYISPNMVEFTAR